MRMERVGKYWRDYESFLGGQNNRSAICFTYEIVLCFPDYKVAIVCDDNDYRDHDIEYEVEGQKASEKNLKCDFICCNPDEENRDVHRVINRLLQHNMGRTYESKKRSFDFL